MGFILGQIEKTYKNVLFRRHDPDGSIFYFSHSDFRGLSFEEFSFLSKRGHRLYGGFYYYENPLPNRLIVFEHGMGSGHNAYFREIELLCKQGYLVYSYDHTGCNRSDGEHIYGLSGSLSDLDDCINALTTFQGYKEENISVIGHSWGGFSSLNILSRHPNIHSIVAMSGFMSVVSMHNQLAPFPFTMRLYEVEKLTNPDYADSEAISTLSTTDRPVLVIHSTDDKTVSYKRNFYPLSVVLKDKSNISFMTVKGSGHSPHYTPEAFAYKESFFKQLKWFRRRGKLKTEEQRFAFASRYDWHRMTEQNQEVWSNILDFLKK